MIVFLVGLAAALFGAAGLSFIADLLERRELRRDIFRAHQPRPFDRERDAA